MPLTTHVLDTTSGRPAAGLRLQLFRLDPAGEGRSLLEEAWTNADGRTDVPLLAELEVGVYEILFDVGEYFAGEEVPAPPFLGLVGVRFGIADPSSHYHVPLLVSPWSYSTYRGS